MFRKKRYTKIRSQVKLTRNFYLYEYDCNNGKQVPEKYINNAYKNAKNLQQLRDYYETFVIIISGYRTWFYNLGVGGALKSKHLTALASDIKIPGVEPIDVYKTIERFIKEGRMEEGGLGLYNTFVHYDPRGNKARWNLSNYKL